MKKSSGSGRTAQSFRSLRGQELDTFGETTRAAVPPGLYYLSAGNGRANGVVEKGEVRERPHVECSHVDGEAIVTLQMEPTQLLQGEFPGATKERRLHQAAHLRGYRKGFKYRFA